MLKNVLKNDDLAVWKKSLCGKIIRLIAAQFSHGGERIVITRTLEATEEGGLEK